MATKPHKYYVSGFPFDAMTQQCSPRQQAAVDELIKAFWGEPKSTRITISIRGRGGKGSGTRCSPEYPICWSRVNNIATCSCDGFEAERGGNKVVITTLKPKGKQ